MIEYWNVWNEDATFLFVCKLMNWKSCKDIKMWQRKLKYAQCSIMENLLTKFILIHVCSSTIQHQCCSSKYGGYSESSFILVNLKCSSIGDMIKF